MIPIPYVLGGFAAFLALRYVARRRDPTLIRLPGGRRARLLSSVAILNSSDCRLVTLEYRSGLPAPNRDDLRREALDLLQTVAAKPEYARCRDATVTVRLMGENCDAPAPQDRILAFHREGDAAAWHAVEHAD